MKKELIKLSQVINSTGVFAYQEAVSTAQYFGNKFFDQDSVAIVKENFDNNQAEIKVRLTVREKQCVDLYLVGNDYEEIATILNISLHSVVYYFKIIKNKINVKSKKDLIKVFSNNYGNLILKNHA